MTEERIEECIRKMESGLDYLLGDPLVPNDKGAIYRIEKHLERQNDRYDKLQSSHNRLTKVVYLLMGIVVCVTGTGLGITFF